MKYFQILFLLLLLNSCKERETNESNLFGFSEIQNVSSIPLNSSNTINRSFELMVIDDYLFVYDPDNEFHYKIIDIKNDSFVKRFGKNGLGPCELSFPTGISRVGNSKNRIGLNNRQKFTFQEYELNEILNSDYVDCKNLTKNMDFNFQKFVKIDSTAFLGVGLFEKRFALYDVSKDSILQNFGDYPFPDLFSSVNFQVLGMAFQGDLIKHPTQPKIVMATNQSFCIDILSYNKKLGLTQINQIHHWAPDFIANEGQRIGVQMKYGNRKGSISATASNNFIYILFSGKQNSQIDYKTSDLIFVYDWNGNPVKVLNLDKVTDLITVDEDDEYIIGYHDDGKANLFKFDLPS